MENILRGILLFPVVLFLISSDLVSEDLNVQVESLKKQIEQIQIENQKMIEEIQRKSQQQIDELKKKIEQMEAERQTEKQEITELKADSKETQGKIENIINSKVVPITGYFPTVKFNTDFPSYFRSRARFIENATFLGATPNTEDQISFADSRFMLSPMIEVTENISLRSQIDVARNAEIVDEYLEFIKNQVVRTNRLVNNLLNFSRPEEPSFKQVNLNSTLENAILLIKKQFTDNNIELCVDLDNSIPEVMGDQNQLWQVFINLLINASQCMQDGGELRVSTYLEKGSSDKVYIIFQDTGEGISEENLPKIFDPFFTTKSKGSGLGLSISYKIIENHSGKIKVNSKQGEGTSFVIELPVNCVIDHDRDAEEKSTGS